MMGGVKKLEEVLQIFLITCNRSALLDNTLRQLKDSPFSDCRFTILDNCSTDNTAEVAFRYCKHFSDYHVVRHNRNIGGDGNYLRAIEFSTGMYTWVLCDDDNFDFSDIADLVEAIISGDYDLIYVASRSPVHLGWDGYGATTAKALIRDGARYHRACTFWPALIFKTRLFEDRFLHHAPYMFPLMKFINKSIDEDFKVYIPKREIVLRFEGSAPEMSPLVLYREWVKNITLVVDSEIKDRVIEQWTDRGFLRTLAFWIAMDRARRTPGLSKCFVEILFALTPWQRARLLLLSPLLVVPVPKRALVRARETVYRLMGTDSKDLPPIDVIGR